MRNDDTSTEIYGTDDGLTCPHCDSKIWSYRVLFDSVVASREASDRADAAESAPRAQTSTVIARCASCKCAESWDSRGNASRRGATIQELKAEHAGRRELCASGRPYALARDFIVRHPLPQTNLIVHAFSRQMAEQIALFQIFGGPVKYVHADDPLDPTIYGKHTPSKPVPCHDCGQDVAVEECAPGWGFLQLHRGCKDAVRRRGMRDVAAARAV